MKIGIGMPATLPGATADLCLEWARRADAGPFSSLSAIDRIVYPSYEPMSLLSAAAAITKRIRLVTSVLIMPLRNAGVFAKQAATLDEISGGRLSLGFGVGGRDTDYKVAPAGFHDRGKRFDGQLALMRRIWSGEPMDGDEPVGPRPVQPGGPEILIGGYSNVVARRAAQWGNGYMYGSRADPAKARQMYDGVEAAWKAAGREGKPRFVGGLYVALGPGAGERGMANVRRYYAWSPAAEAMASAVHSTPERIKQTMKAFEDVGMDEMLFWPVVPEIELFDRLVDLL
jgi:alkanesulfonate monooxygenase SsuD/methylene tetrahydromethanopterin reductase-like flavin-dependent oxidoreductase (luciferase family)